MEHNALKPSGWYRRSGWFAVAAMMALSGLPLQGDTIQAPPVTLVANPLPAGQDQTTLTWNAPNSTGVEVHVGSPTGTLFADGGPTGSAVTGPWVSLGMSFYLVDATTHQPLASAVVQQPEATLTASPNPLPDGVNQATLTWNAPNSLGVEIHVGSPTGTLFAEGGPTGSAVTGPWVTTGMSFYLVDGATKESIASSAIQDPNATSAGALTPQDKAFYLTPDQYNFIRPGLTVKITGGSIAADGTMTANFTVTDMVGLPLDAFGVTTPGVMSLRFTAATIPAGQEQYVSYIYDTTTVNGVTTTQADRDNGGVITPVGSGVGTYTYTFATKAPATFDPTATQTFGMYATRDLTEFDLGTQYSNSTFNFVPNGSPVTVIRDVVNTASCNQCHDPLSAHGGARQIVPLCVMCHTPQSTDPGSNNTVDFKVMVHKIHMGSSLPTVIAGQPYYLGDSPTTGSNYSTVVFPSDVRYCTQCHGPDATQSSTYKTEPTRAACGSCHDNVNFLANCPAGSDPNLCTNHPVVQTSDANCATCHQSKETTEFDLSIPGAHTIQTNSTQLIGVNFAIASATGAAGAPVVVNFSIKNNAGNPISLSQMNSLSLTLASPTTDYAAYDSESALQASGSGGNYTFTFPYSLPANASGSYTVGIEGYINENIITNPHANTTSSVKDAGLNQVLSFSVDGSPVVERRLVVGLSNCTTCHVALIEHGGSRNNTTYCVLCHNPNTTDVARRPSAQAPPETVDFRTLVHKIHRGTDLTQQYTVYGFNSSVNNYNGVLFPGDLRDCAKCHVNSSYQLPINQYGTYLPVQTARSFINPTTMPETQACVSCHDAKSISAHALLNTQAQLGESCDVCHGTGATYSVDAVHAR